MVIVPKMYNVDVWTIQNVILFLMQLIMMVLVLVIYQSFEVCLMELIVMNFVEAWQ